MNENPNRLLEFLTAPVKPQGEGCRSNRRRRSSSRVVLTWPDGGEWRTLRGRLRDISRAGAALFTASPPPLTNRARLRMLQGEMTPWIEAEILGVEKVTAKRHRVRLLFSSPCPTSVLQPAIRGEVTSDDEPAPGPCEWTAWNPGFAE